MGLSRKWNVPEEFWILWWRSREYRQLIMDVVVEPAGKGPAGARSAPEFQGQVMDQMERHHRYPMRGPVALDLHFRAAQRNPPSIHRAVKHTLDLLGPALPGIECPRRRSVLYRDDRQIKFLYADLHQEWSRKDTDDPSSGHIYMVARRANDVAADLCMAMRLHRDRWDEDDEESPFWSPDIPEEPEPRWPLDPGSARTPTEQYLADTFRFHHIMDVQEAILTQTDATMIWALGSYLDDLSDGGGDRPAELASIIEQSQAATRDLLLSYPLALPLPGLPRATGQSADFVRMIRASLEEFRVRWPLFRSLLVPVTLTFLVIPPEQGKDLDNIALTALPIAHEVLRPHISPHLLSPAYGDEERMSRRDDLARLKVGIQVPSPPEDLS